MITMKDLKASIKEVLGEELKELKSPARRIALENEAEDKGTTAKKVLDAGLFYAKVLGLKAVGGGEIKALTDDIMYTGNDGQGGYINAPPATAAEIVTIMKQASVVARLADFRRQEQDVLKVTTDTSSLTVTYTDESVAKTKTKPTLTQTTLTLKKPALQIILSDEEIQGSLVDIVAYLNSKIAQAFGSDLDYRVLGVSASTPYDSIPHVSGVNNVALVGHDENSITYKKCVEATVSILSEALGAARFFMHRTVLGQVLSLVDGMGRPIFQTDPTGKAIGTILGFPVELVERMPTSAEYAAGIVPVLFGDLKNWRVGVKLDLRVKQSGDVAVTLDGSLVSCWENNLTAIRAEARRSGALVLPSTFAKMTLA